MAVLGACDRERVEVGESSSADDPDGSEDAPPSFPTEGGVDAFLPGCGPSPTIGRCTDTCPTGYVKLPDGGSSCECCP